MGVFLKSRGEGYVSEKIYGDTMGKKGIVTAQQFFLRQLLIFSSLLTICIPMMCTLHGADTWIEILIMWVVVKRKDKMSVLQKKRLR